MFNSIHRRSFLLLCIPGLALTAQAQIVLSQASSPAHYVQTVLMGAEVTVSNVTFNGDPGNVVADVGVGPSEIGRFDGSNTCLGLNSGLFLCTGVAQIHIPGPNAQLQSSGGGITSTPGFMTPDMDLSQLTGWIGWEGNPNTTPPIPPGSNIYNKSVLEFDLVPENDMLRFRYVFSSEEYERWACSQYNDAFGLFLSGPGISGPYSNNAMNIAFVPGSLSPVSINTVNSGLLNANNANGPWTDPFQYCFAADTNWQANAQYYRYNGGQWPFAQPPTNAEQLEAPYNTDPYYIQHNGMTVVLTATAAVQLGETYHIKFGVANIFDSKYGSAAFIEKNSFRCSDRFTLTVDEGPNVDLSGADPILYSSELDSVHLRFNRWGGFYLDEHLQIAVEGDAVAEVDYAPTLADSLHFAQLDSAAVVALAIPQHVGGPRELIVHLITSNGDKVMTYRLIIDRQLATHTPSREEAPARLSVFPNPAKDRLHVVLPSWMVGRAELHLLDVAGRVVKQRSLNGAAQTTIDLEGLPTGLYTLRVNAQGQVMTARIRVGF